MACIVHETDCSRKHKALQTYNNAKCCPRNQTYLDTLHSTSKVEQHIQPQRCCIKYNLLLHCRKIKHVFVMHFKFISINRQDGGDHHQQRYPLHNWCCWRRIISRQNILWASQSRLMTWWCQLECLYAVRCL